MLATARFWSAYFEYRVDPVLASITIADFPKIFGAGDLGLNMSIN